MKTFGVVLSLALFSTLSLAQSSLPDAPVPQKESSTPAWAQPANGNAAADQSSAPQQTAPQETKPKAEVPPTPANADNPFPEEESRKAAEEAQTVGAGQAPDIEGSQRDQLPVFRSTVNFVLVPVTVKKNGKMMPGLTRNNFSVYENDSKQQIRFFTSDPFPLSAAIVVDVGMADVALKKVAATFSALQGAFSEFDEASVYSYDNTVKQQEEYVAALGDKITKALKRSGEIYGRGSGPNIYDSPMTSGPTISGEPVGLNIGSSRVHNTRTDEPSRVLNDAILRAAIDLSHRDRSRRKVIVIISDGREDRSTASYSDVLKVLLSNDITLYAVAIDAAAIPGYARLSRIRLPRQGYGNILPKYASATGGDTFTDFTRNAIEKVFSQMTDEARNQYTIGYYAPKSVVNNYRRIEVKVNQPGLTVVARDGYYPLPPSRK